MDLGGGAGAMVIGEAFGEAGVARVDLAVQCAGRNGATDGGLLGKSIKLGVVGVVQCIFDIAVDEVFE